MGSKRHVLKRMLWTDMWASEQYSGRWVALDNVRYDPTTSQPMEADIVDADEDLGDLCTRMRESDRTSCAILLCEEEPRSRPIARRTQAVPPRAAQH